MSVNSTFHLNVHQDKMATIPDMYDKHFNSKAPFMVSVQLSQVIYILMNFTPSSCVTIGETSLIATTLTIYNIIIDKLCRDCRTKTKTNTNYYTKAVETYRSSIFSDGETHSSSTFIVKNSLTIVKMQGRKYATDSL